MNFYNSCIMIPESMHLTRLLIFVYDLNTIYIPFEKQGISINKVRTYFIAYYYTQLFGTEYSWNLNEISPAVSLSSLALMTMSSSDMPSGSGRTCLSLGCRENSTWDGNGTGAALKLDLSSLGGGEAGLSHNITWIMIGIFACLCNDNFWLSETVS